MAMRAPRESLNPIQKRFVSLYAQLLVHPPPPSLCVALWEVQVRDGYRVSFTVTRVDPENIFQAGFFQGKVFQAFRLLLPRGSHTNTPRNTHKNACKCTEIHTRPPSYEWGNTRNGLNKACAIHSNHAHFITSYITGLVHFYTPFLYTCNIILSAGD